MARFQPLATYEAPLASGYELLPLHFRRLAGDRVFVANMVGEWEILSSASFEALTGGYLDYRTSQYGDLKAKHMIVDRDSSIAYDLLALKYQARISHLREVLGLAIFVVTLRCEHSCPYCQVSRQSDDRVAFDMSEATAEMALVQLFASPAVRMKIEFQGGESLLNFPLIKSVVARAKQLATQTEKIVSFVIATNLAPLTDEILSFCAAEGVSLSTSLDGPVDLHNKNRPRRGNNSHQLAVEGIRRTRETLGDDSISALMTTTKNSLGRVVDIIDEYRRIGLQEIFLRPLSPYGFALKTKTYRAYDGSDWLKFYREGLDYILTLNRNGERMVEIYAATLLRKMLTPLPGGYVDLMNPAGIGRQVLVFNYDGDVYASDEARMLAEMGDTTFRLGNVHSDDLADMLLRDTLMDAVEQSAIESAPMCSDCAYQNFCGADPVYHHATQGDFVGRKPASGFCQRQLSVIDLLVDLMTDPETARILRSWVA